MGTVGNMFKYIFACKWPGRSVHNERGEKGKVLGFDFAFLKLHSHQELKEISFSLE